MYKRQVAEKGVAEKGVAEKGVAKEMSTLFLRKYRDNSYTLTGDNQILVTDGVIKKVSMLSGVQRIKPEAGGSLFLFSIPKTIEGREFYFYCMFTVVPHCPFDSSLSLGDVFKNRNLTQFYLWRRDMATGEQWNLAIREGDEGENKRKGTQ